MCRSDESLEPWCQIPGEGSFEYVPTVPTVPTVPGGPYASRIDAGSESLSGRVM